MKKISIFIFFISTSFAQISQKCFWYKTSITSLQYKIFQMKKNEVDSKRLQFHENNLYVLFFYLWSDEIEMEKNKDPDIITYAESLRMDFKKVNSIHKINDPLRVKEIKEKYPSWNDTSNFLIEINEYLPRKFKHIHSFEDYEKWVIRFKEWMENG